MERTTASDRPVGRLAVAALTGIGGADGKIAADGAAETNHGRAAARHVAPGGKTTQTGS